MYIQVKTKLAKKEKRKKKVKTKPPHKDVKR